VNAAAGGALPSPWVAQTVGAPQTGGASFANGVFTVTGYGEDIWGTRDEFEYVNQSLAGDAMLIARITSIQDTNLYAKAGLMWREALTVDAATVLLDTRPDGSLEFMARTSAGAFTT